MVGPGGQVKTSILDPELVRDRHARLADAAAYLFRRKGYFHTTIADIAEQAQISVGSVYRYIRAKEDILVLIIRVVMDRYETHVRPILHQALPPDVKLARFVNRYIRHIEQARDGVMVIYRDAHVLGPRIRSALEETDRIIVGDICEIIREGVATGIFRSKDPNLVAHNVIAISHVWVLRHWRFPGTFSVSDYIRAQLPNIFAQLGMYELPTHLLASLHDLTEQPPP
jgi:AcrR family transcriptional regulator